MYPTWKLGPCVENNNLSLAFEKGRGKLFSAQMREKESHHAAIYRSCVFAVNYYQFRVLGDV